MLGCDSNAPTLSCACFCECNSQQPRTKWGSDALLHHSDPGIPPDEATPDGTNSLYCFNFLTQRGQENLDACCFSKIKCNPEQRLVGSLKWKALEDGNSGLRTAVVCANSW